MNAGSEDFTKAGIKSLDDVLRDDNGVVLHGMSHSAMTHSA